MKIRSLLFALAVGITALVGCSKDHPDGTEWVREGPLQVITRCPRSHAWLLDSQGMEIYYKDGKKYVINYVACFATENCGWQGSYTNVYVLKTNTVTK